LLVTSDIIPSLPILVTLMIEAMRSSETSILIRASRRNIPEDCIIRSHRHENLKSYNNLSIFYLTQYWEHSHFHDFEATAK
jgi:hypothetical protein